MPKTRNLRNKNKNKSKNKKRTLRQVGGAVSEKFEKMLENTSENSTLHDQDHNIFKLIEELNDSMARPKEITGFKNDLDKFKNAIKHVIYLSLHPDKTPPGGVTLKEQERKNMHKDYFQKIMIMLHGRTGKSGNGYSGILENPNVLPNKQSEEGLFNEYIRNLSVDAARARTTPSRTPSTRSVQLGLEAPDADDANRLRERARAYAEAKEELARLKEAKAETDALPGQIREITQRMVTPITNDPTPPQPSSRNPAPPRPSNQVHRERAWTWRA